MRRRSAWGFMRVSEFRMLVTLIHAWSAGYHLHVDLIAFCDLSVRQVLLMHL